ncbi:unnamed protein product [Ectocarpus sp. 4 AP-2014]
MAAAKRPTSEEAVAPLVEVMAELEQQSPLPDSGCVQQHQQPPGFAAVEGVPVARATMRPFAYVGVPIDVDNNNELRRPSRAAASCDKSRAGVGRVHGDVSVGVGADYDGAEEAAKASAKRDNAAFFEQRRFTEAQAKSRVEEDLRAIETARINAKRRDAEGLDMRPHPGNRLEPEDTTPLGNKERDYGAGGGGYGGSVQESSGKEPAAVGGESAAGKGGEQEASGGGYQFAEYVPAEYDIPEYKSVYERPSGK